jgi:phosphatidylserine/phosphatidylglycerophosphate/cardiolipin synthase-like enzyme
MRNSKLVYTFLVLIAINLSSCFSPHQGRSAIDSGLNTSGTSQTEVFFTPWDDAEAAIASAIESAEEKIYIQAYVWTSKPLTKSLIKAKSRGVKIYILADKEQMQNSDASLIPELAKQNIPINLETKYQNAHNKVIIIDPKGSNPKVITGSYNFSYSAQYKNAENVLIIHDASIVNKYLANWRRHQQDASAY